MTILPRIFWPGSWKHLIPIRKASCRMSDKAGGIKRKQNQSPERLGLQFHRKVCGRSGAKKPHLPAEWIYGLYRADAKELLMSRWFELGNPWCFASYVVSEFVVLDLVAYVDGATLDFTEGSGSEARYRAKSFRDRLTQRLKYTTGCYALVKKLPDVSWSTRMKFFRMCWNDARRKTRYKLFWVF